MNKIKIKIGIYALSMLSMATLIVSPVMGLIVKAFPYESLNKVQMIIAVANLTGLIAAFIVGRLSISISKRSLYFRNVYLWPNSLFCASQYYRLNYSFRASWCYCGLYY